MADITLSNFELEVIGPRAGSRCCWTSGRPGAAPARRSGRCWRSWRRPTPAASCWPSSTPTSSPRSPGSSHACSACAASPCACCSRTASRWTASSARCRRASCARLPRQACAERGRRRRPGRRQSAPRDARRRHVDDGIAALKHALELDPANDGARCACLLALIRAGRLAEAREVHAPVAGRGTPATDDLAAAGLWLEACEQSTAADEPAEATPQEQPLSPRPRAPRRRALHRSAGRAAGNPHARQELGRGPRAHHLSGDPAADAGHAGRGGNRKAPRRAPSCRRARRPRAAPATPTPTTGACR